MFAAAVALVLATIAAGALSVLAYQRTEDAKTDQGADPSATPSKKPSGQGNASPDSPGATSLALPAEGKLSVLLLGDEIMSGVGASAIEARPYNLLVEAIGFDRVEALGGGPELSVKDTGDIEDLTADSAPHDLIVIEIGTEDMPTLEPSEFADPYEDAIAVARESSPDGALVCVGVWASSKSAKPYDAIIRSACNEEDGIFVKVSDIYDRDSSRGPKGRDGLVDRQATEGTIGDGTLPNDTGYASLAKRVGSAVEVEIDATP